MVTPFTFTAVHFGSIYLKTFNANLNLATKVWKGGAVLGCLAMKEISIDGEWRQEGGRVERVGFHGEICRSDGATTK